MRENTPPHRPDFIDDDDDEILEEIDVDAQDEPFDEDELDDEVRDTLAQLSQFAENSGSNDEDDEDDDKAIEQARISAIKDDAVLTFRKHSSPLFACALHPRHDWAVTGSQDDRAIVWNTSNGEVLYEIGDHKDTVTETHFNHDGIYLATGDLSGLLVLHKISEDRPERPVFTKVWEYFMSDMTWMFWHRAANILIAGSESGEIYVWRLPNGDCKVLPGQAERCNSGALTADGKKLLSFYGNGVLKLWDLKSCQVLMEINQQHPLFVGECSHAVVACVPDSPLCVCAIGSGKLFFCTSNGPVQSVESGSSEIECIDFAPASSGLKLLACGALDGNVTIFDYNNYSVRCVCVCPVPNDGVLRVKWLNDSTLLAATTQGNLNAFDGRSGALKFSLTGHHYHIYELAYKAENNLLLTVSEDATAKIFMLPPLGE